MEDQSALKEQLESIALQIDSGIDRYLETLPGTAKSQALEKKLAKLEIRRKHVSARIRKSTDAQRKYNQVGTQGLNPTRVPNRLPKQRESPTPDTREPRALISLATGITNQANRRLRRVSDGPCPAALVVAATEYAAAANRTIGIKVGPCHPLHPNYAGDTEAALSDATCNHGISIPF